MLYSTVSVSDEDIKYQVISNFDLVKCKMIVKTHLLFYLCILLIFDCILMFQYSFKPIPWKAILLAFFLCVGGTCLLITGSLIVSGHIDEKVSYLLKQLILLIVKKMAASKSFLRL